MTAIIESYISRKKNPSPNANTKLFALELGFFYQEIACVNVGRSKKVTSERQE